MSRRTRKQMVGKLENQESELLVRELRHLRRELHWQWRMQVEDRYLLGT